MKIPIPQQRAKSVVNPAPSTTSRISSQQQQRLLICHHHHPRRHPPPPPRRTPRHRDSVHRDGTIPMPTAKINSTIDRGCKIKAIRVIFSMDRIP